MDKRMLETAMGQHGLVSRQQAMEAGLKKDQYRNLTRRGGWEPIRPGVIRAPGSPDTWHQQLEALVLWAGPHMAFSHRTAAGLWGFTGIEEGQLEMETLKNARGLGASVVVHRRAPEAKCTTEKDGFPVTNQLYTLLELGAVASRDEVESALEGELVKETVSLSGLRWVLEQFGQRGLAGTATLSALVAERASGYVPLEGVLELLFVRLLKKAGLLPPLRQVQLPGGRVDFYWARLRLVVELDGFDSHGRRQQFQKDRDRDNAHVVNGERTLRFTWYDLKHRPEYVVRSLKEAGVQGYSQDPQSAISCLPG